MKQCKYSDVKVGEYYIVYKNFIDSKGKADCKIVELLKVEVIEKRSINASSFYYGIRCSYPTRPRIYPNGIKYSHGTSRCRGSITTVYAIKPDEILISFPFLI